MIRKTRHETSGWQQSFVAKSFIQEGSKNRKYLLCRKNSEFLKIIFLHPEQNTQGVFKEKEKVNARGCSNKFCKIHDVVFHCSVGSARLFFFFSVYSRGGKDHLVSEIIRFFSSLEKRSMKFVQITKKKDRDWRRRKAQEICEGTIFIQLQLC